MRFSKNFTDDKTRPERLDSKKMLYNFFYQCVSSGHTYSKCNYLITVISFWYWWAMVRRSKNICCTLAIDVTCNKDSTYSRYTLITLMQYYVISIKSTIAISKINLRGYQIIIFSSELFDNFLNTVNMTERVLKKSCTMLITCSQFLSNHSALRPSKCRTKWVHIINITWEFLVLSQSVCDQKRSTLRISRV